MKVECGKLIPGISMMQLVIGQLLDGIRVNVCVDGCWKQGFIHNLDMAPGKSDHLFAKVNVPDLGEDGHDIKVAIFRDGQVTVLPLEGQE